MSKAKRNSLVLLSVAALLIIILAMALPNLTLLPGQPFALEQQNPALNPMGATTTSNILLLLFRGTVALILIGFIAYVIYSLMTPEGRKRLILNVLMLVILLAIADYLRNNLPQAADQPEQPMEMSIQPNQNGEGIAATPFPTSPPQWLTLGIILILSIVIGVFILALIWFLWRRKPEPKSALDELAEEAQNAIESLSLGADFRMTIIRCYQEMSRVLKAERGIARDISMTPREFEVQLVGKGLPQASIKTLTRLFEQARYGGVSSQTSEEDLAVSCLTDIVNACKLMRSQYEG